MTSLYPGLLFYSTGLNKKSTPTKPEATPSEIDQRLGRVAFNGRPWPKSSPVSSVYDVRNSSTRMIILNNKLARRPKGSRLRGQTDHQGEIQTPQPNRHIQEEPKTNCEYHKNCNTYNSEKFVPVFPPSTPSPAWVNNQQRPPMKFDNGSLVNPNHHIHCQGHMDYDIMRWYNAQRSRPRSRVSTITKEEERSLSPILSAPGLKAGEKRYLSSIARIYSVTGLKAQTTDRYKQLMNKEIGKDRKNTRITTRLTRSQYGLRTYKYSDWDKYNRYLSTPRKTQFGPCDTFKEKSNRSASAPGPGTRKSSQDAEERPHTTQTGIKSGNSSARSTAKTPRGSDRPSGRKGKDVKKSGKTQASDDLTGKPARVESPMPLKPRESVSPSLSESDIDDSEKETKKENPPTEKTEEAKVESPKVESSKGEDVEETQRADNETADEDERSKMSAREGNEQRGNNVEYHPTNGDLRDERSKEQSSEKEVKTSDKETYQPTSSTGKDAGSQEPAKAVSATVESTVESPKVESPKVESPKQESPKEESPKEESPKEESPKEESPKVESPKVESPKVESPKVESPKVESPKVESPKVESPKVESPKHQSPSASAEDVKSKSASRESLDDKKTEGSSADKDGPDRPLSQLGGSDKFNVVKKDNNNSDNDYSDDEDVASPKNKGQGDQAVGGAKDTQAAGSQPTDDKVSQATEESAATEQKTESSEARLPESTPTEGTPTEASQEKPSDISTIDY